MESNSLLSIAVCTCNRPVLLNQCLQSILSSTGINSVHQILVIDNGSEKLSMANFPASEKIVLYREENQGLSHARNLALNKCQTTWLAFIDDDSKVEKDFVLQAMSLVNQGYAAFGGIYIPWYDSEKKKWFKDRWASSAILRSDSGELPRGRFFPGGISVWNVKAALAAGAFPSGIGMKGNKVSYGEEVYLQKKLIENGEKLGYNPELQIRHRVSPEKMTLRWLLKSAFAKGRDSWEFSREESPSPMLLVKIFIKTFLQLPVNFLTNLLCFIQRKELHFKTVLANTFIPFANGLGRLTGRKHL